jgi:hypothetical protein
MLKAPSSGHVAIITTKANRRILHAHGIDIILIHS